jgi:hypothetical protein
VIAAARQQGVFMAPSMEAKAGSEIPKGSAALDRLRDDIRTLYGPGGELSKLDSPGTAAEALLPKLVLEGDKLRRFGRNGIITHRDGTREVFHQGRRFIVNKNGTIQGDRPGSVVKGMWFDAADNTIRFKQGDVRITYNPEEDKTTIKNDKGIIEINRQGVLYYDRESRKYKKFRALDGSFSITMDEKGVASVTGRDGRDLPRDHPHAKLMDLKGKTPKISGDGDAFTIPAGPGVTRTFYPGSHSVLKRGDKVEEVDYGGKTILVTEKGPGTMIRGRGVRIDADRRRGDKVEIGDDGLITVKFKGGKIVEIDPARGTETEIEGSKAKVKFVDIPGKRKGYSLEMSRDAKKNWGVTSIDDERGLWKVDYKPGSRAASDITKISGPGGTFDVKDKVAGLDISPDGDLTVRFKPGQKYTSVAIKPGKLEEVYTAPDNHKVTLKYTRVIGPAKLSEVNDGSKTYKVSYDGDGNIDALRDKDRKPLYKVGDNAKSIAFDPVTKGFKVTLNAGEEVEIDPTRRSERLSKIVGGKRVTLETFHDNHKVFSEKDKDGPVLVRGFSDTAGQRYKVAHTDKGINVTYDGGARNGRPIAGVRGFATEKVTDVTDEGVVKFKAKDHAGKEVTIDRLPDNTKVITWKDGSGRSEKRDANDLVIETTRPGGGTIIDRLPPRFAAGLGVRELTLKGEGGATFTLNKDGSYEYRDPNNRGAGVIVLDRVLIQAGLDGNIVVNGKNLGREPKAADILKIAADADPFKPKPGEPKEIADARRRAAEKVKDAFRGDPLDGGRDGVKFRDGSSVERIKDKATGNLLTIVTSLNPVTGLPMQIRYTQDAKGMLTKAENPDGTVWLRVRNYRNGAGLWQEQNTGRLSIAKTEGMNAGQKLGLDQYGVLNFTTYRPTIYGWQGVNVVCLRNYTNLLAVQYQMLKRAGLAA